MKPTLFRPIPAACLALILLPSLFLLLSILHSSHVDYNFWITANKEFLKTESGSKPGTVVCHNLIDFLVRDPFPYSVPSVRSGELPESYNFPPYSFLLNRQKILFDCRCKIAYQSLPKNSARNTWFGFMFISTIRWRLCFHCESGLKWNRIIIQYHFIF